KAAESFGVPVRSLFACLLRRCWWCWLWQAFCLPTLVGWGLNDSLLAKGFLSRVIHCRYLARRLFVSGMRSSRHKVWAGACRRWTAVVAWLLGTVMHAMGLKMYKALVWPCSVKLALRTCWR